MKESDSQHRGQKPKIAAQGIPVLVHIRYKDHTLFRNANLSLCQPSTRESVGWIVKENEEAVWILWDRSVTKLPYEWIKPSESGLVILKSNILEMKKLG